MNEYKEQSLQKSYSNLKHYKQKHEQIKYFNYKNRVWKQGSNSDTKAKTDEDDREIGRAHV